LKSIFNQINVQPNQLLAQNTRSLTEETIKRDPQKSDQCNKYCLTKTIIKWLEKKLNFPNNNKSNKYVKMLNQVVNNQKGQ